MGLFKVLYKYKYTCIANFVNKGKETHKNVTNLGEKLLMWFGGEWAYCSCFYGFASQDQHFKIYDSVWMHIYIL